jgi:hypothetical protein
VVRPVVHGAISMNESAAMASGPRNSTRYADSRRAPDDRLCSVYLVRHLFIHDRAKGATEDM